MGASIGSSSGLDDLAHQPRLTAGGDLLFASADEVAQLPVIEAEQVQQRGLEVVGSDDIDRSAVTDFVGSEVSENNLSGFRVPGWAYLVAAPFVIGAALYLSGVLGRRLRKLRLANAAVQPGQEAKRKGKRRR